MSRRDPHDEEMARAAREVAGRAVRRLEVLEWVFFAAAAALAVLGGALVSALLAEPLGVAFRSLWIVTSVALFAVPGAFAILKMRHEERSIRERSLNDNDGSHV